MKHENIIFNNVLIAKNKIRNIKIGLDKTFHTIPVIEITIGFDNGDFITSRVNFVSAKDIEDKFGTIKETLHAEKGLNYENAKSAMKENNYSDILIAIQNILNDKKASINGDILTQLKNNGVFDKYKKQYLSLTRKTTDEEFKQIQQEHELEELMNELVSEQNENKRCHIYNNIKLLYKEAYRRKCPTMDNILRSYEETLKYREILRRLLK